MKIVVPGGISLVRASMNDATSSTEANKQPSIESGVNPKRPYTNSHRPAFAASIRGYWAEMRLWQPEHRPRRASQLKMGTISYHFSRLPQVMQWEGPVTMLSPAGMR
jgi:hypothetical protein